MPAQLFDQLHPDWQKVLKPHADLIHQIEIAITAEAFTPNFDNIFRALTHPVSATRVVIFGQDPYPSKGHAHGLAFSVDESVQPIPASLRNIFVELHEDCGVIRNHGDLSDWFNQGVMLMNRVLTTQVGASLAHMHLGWQEITTSVARTLGQQDTVAILWGKTAGELAGFFREELRIQSPHPSPLSAYRGFFGSKPFSRTNEILKLYGYDQIIW